MERALKTLEEFDKVQPMDEVQRVNMLTRIQAVARRLEKPAETILRMTHAEPAITAGVKVAYDLGIFEHLLNQGPSTAEAITEAIHSPGVNNCKVELVKRILRVCYSVNAVELDTRDNWSGTTLSKSIVESLGACLDYHDLIIGPTVGALPRFLKETQFEEPTNSKWCAFQLAMNTMKDFFGWSESSSKSAATFNTAMTSIQCGRIPWFEIYPLWDRSLRHFQVGSEAIFLVDVGGGYGHDISALVNEHHILAGHLALQDLQSTHAVAKGLEPGVKVMVHDFFQPQPIRGACIYYLGSILHDWPDEQAFSILSQLAKAMKPGLSKIVLREPILPEKTRPPVLAAAMDLVMMSFSGAHERTRSEWEMLLASAGLRISGTWEYPGGLRHIIEAVKI